MVKLDPQYRIIFGEGGRIDATPSSSKMEQQIAKMSPNDVHGFQRFMNENRRKFADMLPCLENPFSGWKDLLTPRMLSLLPTLRPGQSLDHYLKRFFKDHRVRLAFCFQSKYLGMSPFQCPSLFSILSFLEYEFGVFHPLGGCASITNAMSKVAQHLGVKIHLGEGVHKIIFEGRKAVGVKSNLATYRSEAVVINADFARAMERLVPDDLRTRWSNQQLSKKRFSCSAFMMYLGLRGTFSLPHHTIFISEKYKDNLNEIEDHHLLSDDPSFYIQNACITDPDLAPTGKSTLYVLVPVSHVHQNVDWKKERNPFRERVLRQLRKAGFDELEGRIEYEKIITPADWDHQYEVYRGAIFSLSHCLDQMLHFRPHNRFEELDRTYLVGGGTHPGSGLPVIFQSALISSRLLLEDLGISRE